MKKTLIALAAVLAAGAASAQSSVTLFGVVDVAFTHASGSGAARNWSGMTTGQYAPSRWGVMGKEDLGGGMAASFVLDSEVFADSGNTQGGGPLTFNRRSTVSLSGNWGELRLGRDYVPTYWNDSVFDPFGTRGVGANVVAKANSYIGTAGLATNGNYVRANNSVGYFLPANLGGIYGQAMYSFHENTAAALNDSGRYVGARLGFAQGPFDVAASWGKTEGDEAVAPAGIPDTRIWNLGGKWDFGVARLMGMYGNTKQTRPGSNDATSKGWLIGGLVPVGAGEVRLSYSRAKINNGTNEGKASQWALGYVHNLSKRTALYASLARVNNSGFAAGQGISLFPSATNGGAGVPAGFSPNGDAHSTGYDLGIRHTF